MFRIAIALAACALLGACVAAPTTTVGGSTAPAATVAPIQSFLTKGATAIAADANAATADAVATGDSIGAACYPTLAKWAQSVTGVTSPTIPLGAGLLYAQQKLRDLAGTPGFKIPDYVKLGCAALVISDEVWVAQFSAFIAAAVASGGASVPTAASAAIGLPSMVNPATLAAPLIGQ